jgi:hypothetical protein
MHIEPVFTFIYYNCVFHESIYHTDIQTVKKRRESIYAINPERFQKLFKICSCVIQALVQSTTHRESFITPSFPINLSRMEGGYPTGGNDNHYNRVHYEFDSPAYHLSSELCEDSQKWTKMNVQKNQ